MDKIKMLFLFSLLFAVTFNVKAEDTGMRNDTLMLNMALCGDSVAQSDTTL